MRNNAGQQSSPVLVMRSGVGSAGGLVVYRVALRSTHSHVRLCRSILLSDFAPCPPSLSGKYEVSIMVPLLLQCDGAWWLPLNGVVMVALQHSSCAQDCHGYPTCSAIVLPYLSRHPRQAYILLMSSI